MPTLRTEEPTVPRLGRPFGTGRPRKRPVDMIVLHESVTVSREACEAVLRRKGYGVHYIVDEYGQLWVYDDPHTTSLAHASKLNSRSIGLELVNPYYPNAAALSRLWKDRPVNKERWAHLKRYVMPLPESFEALYLTCLTLCDEFGIPARMVDEEAPGILAHAHSHYDTHADGVAPGEYVAARLAGATPAQAYAKLSEDQ